MLKYIVGQIGYTIPTLLIISLLVFIIIELPPGDYLTSYVTRLQEVGARTTEEEVLALKKQYGLDQPIYMRYIKWLWRMLHGDFGVSLTHNKPVSELIWDRVGLTFAVSFSALLINWAIAFPVGIYSAVRQYSAGDYVFTSLAFISAATPQFMIALVIMWILFSRYNFTMGGLFSMGMENQPASVEIFPGLTISGKKSTACSPIHVIVSESFPLFCMAIASVEI